MVTACAVIRRRSIAPQNSRSSEAISFSGLNVSCCRCRPLLHQAPDLEGQENHGCQVVQQVKHVEWPGERTLRQHTHFFHQMGLGVDGSNGHPCGRQDEQEKRDSVKPTHSALSWWGCTAFHHARTALRRQNGATPAGRCSFTFQGASHGLVFQEHGRSRRHHVRPGGSRQRAGRRWCDRHRL